MDCSPPGSSVHGILQAGILEWVATPSSRGSSQPRGLLSPNWQAGSLPLAPPGTPRQPWTHTKLPQELFQHPRQGLMWKSCLTFPRTAPPARRCPEPPNVAPCVCPRLPRGRRAPPHGGVRDYHYLVRIALKDSSDPSESLCVFWRKQQMKRWGRQGEDALGLQLRCPREPPGAGGRGLPGGGHPAVWPPASPALSLLQGYGSPAGWSTRWARTLPRPLFQLLSPCLYPSPCHPYNCKVDSVSVVENWPLQQYSF